MSIRTRTGFTFLPPSQVGRPSPLLADNIDPATKDYKSLFVGADPVDAAVQVAVSTTRGSGPCVVDVGIRITSRKITNDFAKDIESDTRIALDPIVQRRDIDVIGVTVETKDGQQFAQNTVRYRNLRAFDARERNAPLASSTK